MRIDPKLFWTVLAEILLAGVLCAAEIRRRKAGGALLFDLGFIRPWGVGITTPGARLAFALAMLMVGVFDTFLPGRWFMGLAYVYLGELSTFSIPRKVQIRDAGILSANLIRWDEIREYEVSPRGFLRLRLAGQWWKRFDVEIPEAFQPHVSRLFAARVPVQEARIAEDDNLPAEKTR